MRRFPATSVVVRAARVGLMTIADFEIYYDFGGDLLMGIGIWSGCHGDL
jgi:hypothetical protein